MQTSISPSIIAIPDLCNIANFLPKAGVHDIVQSLHFDVMDGNFVSSITYGHCMLEAITKATELSIDVHLMVNKPQNHISSFAAVGPRSITVHIEACTNPALILSQIKTMNVLCGIALNPSTSEVELDYLLDSVDIILIMTVNPGACGQAFISNQMRKIERVRSMIDRHGKKIELIVDGGVTDQNIRDIAGLGVDKIVCGSFLFNGDYAQNITKLQRGLYGRDIN